MDDAKPASQSLLSQLRDSGPAPSTAVVAKSWNDRALALALFALLTLVLLAPLMTYNELPLTGEGSTQRQIGYLAILGLAIYGARPATARWKLVAMPVPVLLALGWCWLSLAWAIEPDIGVRRLLLTSVIVWTIFLIVQQAGYRTSLDIVRAVLVLALLANYAVVFLDPVTGIHMMKDSAMPTAIIGNWRGFLVHKNFAGAACAITILLFLFDAKKLHTGLRVAVLLLAGYFLFRSQSKTSAGMTVLASLAALTFHFYTKRFRAYAVPAIAVLASLGWMIFSAYEDMLRFNYLAPSAFTGRGYIWSMLVKYAGDHLVTGAGFGSFWNIGAYSPVYQYGSGMLTQITVGHNGYLDLLVTIGLPGLILTVFALVVRPLWQLLTNDALPAERGALITALLIFCIGHNVTESSLFARDAMVGFFLMLAVAFAQNAAVTKARTAKKQSAGDDLMRSLRHKRREAKAAP